MIRINLLGGERKVAKKAFTFDSGRQVMVACGLLLVLTVGGRPAGSRRACSRSFAT